MPESAAIAQYYDNPGQTVGNKRPLNQLPPIVSADKGGDGKGLFMPSDVSNLPPIVTPNQKTKAPFVYQQNSPSNAKPKVLGPLAPQPQNLPPIVSGSQASPVPSVKTSPVPKLQTPQNLPPVVSAPRSSTTFTPPIRNGLPAFSPTTPPAISNPVTHGFPKTTVTGNGLPAFSNNFPKPQTGSGTPAFSTKTPKAVSSSGVPIYSTNNPPTGALRPPTAPKASGPFPIPVVQDGSGTRSLPPVGDLRSSLEPGAMAPAPGIPLNNTPVGQGVTQGRSPFIESPLPETPVLQGSGTRSLPGSGIVESAPPIPASSSVPGGVVIPNGPGTNNYFATQSIAGVDSGCSTCGPSGCYDPAMIQQQNGCCGSVSNAGYYMFLDAMFWSRADGDVQLSSSFGLNDFNFVGGGRVTLGQRDNATSGRELTYFGTGDLDEIDVAESAAGSLQSLFTATGGLNFAQVSGFNNAVLHRQEKESSLHSLELNRVKWGWDVLKTMIGVRYIYFDDSYEFFSRNNVGVNGLFVQDAVNNLFGVNGGFELFYDVGYRTSASLQTKFGAYVNSANVDTSVFNAGAPILLQEEDDASIASTIEVNFTSHFQLSPRSRFRFGYDLLLGWGMFTVENNIPRNTFANGFQIGTPVLTSATGTNLNTNDEAVVFHGPSFGFEIFR